MPCIYQRAGTCISSCHLDKAPLPERKQDQHFLHDCPAPLPLTTIDLLSVTVVLLFLKFSINGILQCFLLCLAFTQHDALEIQPYCCMCSWPSIPLVLVSWVQPTTCKKYSEKKNSRKLQKTKLEFTPCQPLFS